MDFWQSINGFDIVSKIRGFGQYVLGSGIAGFLILKLIPQERIKNEFKKSLEKYKAEYQKSIKSFDLYRTEKHEAYKKINLLLFETGLLSWGLDIYSHVITVENYNNHSDEEFWNMILEEFSANIRFSENDKGKILSKRGDREELNKSLSHMTILKKINKLDKAVGEFSSYLHSKQLFMTSSIFDHLTNIEGLVKNLITLYYRYEKTEDKENENSQTLKGIIDKIGDQLKDESKKLVELMREELQENKSGV